MFVDLLNRYWFGCVYLSNGTCIPFWLLVTKAYDMITWLVVTAVSWYTESLKFSLTETRKWIFRVQVSRKLAFVEDELEVAEDRVKSGDAKIMELEEELKVVGNSLKSLEVSEEKVSEILHTPEISWNPRNGGFFRAPISASWEINCSQPVKRLVIF